jgi:hypothetical protein
VTGRLLVGLRWWNEIKDDGTNVWVFESREGRPVNPVDSRVFWVSLYAAPGIWVLFGIGALFKLSLGWGLVVIVALVLNMANVIGYTRCEKVTFGLHRFEPGAPTYLIYHTGCSSASNKLCCKPRSRSRNGMGTQ